MIKPLFQKVLVAFNGSKTSLNSLLYSIIMAKSYGCRLKVVYVVDTASIKQLTLSKFMIAEEAREIETSLESDGKKNLEYAETLAKSKGIEIETQLCHGAVWAEIVKTADSFNADLVLLGGARENSSSCAYSRAISGTNSEIIGSAHCSVMVVNDPLIEQKFRLIKK